MTQSIEYDEDDVVEIVRKHVEGIYGSGWLVRCDARVEKADRPYEADRVVVTFTAKTRATP